MDLKGQGQSYFRVLVEGKIEEKDRLLEDFKDIWKRCGAE